MYRVMGAQIGNIDAPWVCVISNHKPARAAGKTIRSLPMFWHAGALYRVMSYRKVSD